MQGEQATGGLIASLLPSTCGSVVQVPGCVPLAKTDPQGRVLTLVTGMLALGGGQLEEVPCHYLVGLGGKQSGPHGVQPQGLRCSWGSLKGQVAKENSHSPVFPALSLPGEGPRVAGDPPEVTEPRGLSCAS